MQLKLYKLSKINLIALDNLFIFKIKIKTFWQLWQLFSLIVYWYWSCPASAIETKTAVKPQYSYNNKIAEGVNQYIFNLSLSEL